MKIKIFQIIRTEEISLKFFFLSILVCAFLFNANFALADTFYVDINKGLDSNPGTSAEPWKTFHYSLSVIGSGTASNYTLHVAAGNYSLPNEEDAELILSKDNVTIIGAGNGAIGAGDPTVVIDGTGASSWQDGIVITGSNCIIKGLSFTNFPISEAAGYGILITGESSDNEIANCSLYGNSMGIEINYSANCKIHHCKIYENTNNGVNILSSSAEVYRNAVYRNGDEGIDIIDCSPDIVRNKIYDNSTGVRVYVNSGNAASPSIRNNVIYETTDYNMAYGILVRYIGATSTPSPSIPAIYHNSIDGASGDGIAVELVPNEISDLAPLIKYNIITRCDVHGIDIGADVLDYTINYNDVWHNGPNGRGTKADNYNGCDPGTEDLYGVTPGDGLGKDPQNGEASKPALAAASPCINAIPQGEGDPVTLDYPGFIRPRPGKTTKDMGAYEYVADVTVNYTMPGGTGAASDYRIFAIPLNLGTGADMLTAMESVLGAYDPVHWRAFLYNGASYSEFNSSQFASHTIKPGMGFWIITTYTDIIPFKGQPAPDGVDYVMDLQPGGWYLIGLPWTTTSILLSTIKVTDGINTYSFTGQPVGEELTQRFLWDYTGDGPFNGYEKQSAVGFHLQNNKGYFLKVLSSTPVSLIIPHPVNANLAQEAPIDMPPNQTNTNENDETPPPPPGAEPIPDIKANGQDGPIAVNAGDSVAVSVSLDPGAWNGQNADWWLAAHTPFASPWYTYVSLGGWKSGIHVGVQMPLSELLGPLNVLNMVLPVGSYTFYFAVDGNMDGAPDATWMDSVQVNVE